jgi:ABC-type multidrug transport system ATPase subunit
MIPMNIIQIAENQYVPLYVNTLLFTRGDESNETNIKMEDVKFEKGHIYAVTGGNGSGKSSFFEILTLQGNNPNILGFSRCEGEIQTSSKNLTLVSQNPYCPLYITPFQWIVKMETSKLSQLSEEENDKLRYKILNYSKKLKLFNEGDDNNLENILDIQQDNWYRTISGGEKIKVELIRQVFLDEKCPEILLLDEIFGPLDSAIKTVVMDEIAEHCSDSTILIIYHNEKECVDTGFFTDNLHFADGEATLRDMC